MRVLQQKMKLLARALPRKGIVSKLPGNRSRERALSRLLGWSTFSPLSVSLIGGVPGPRTN